MTSKEAYEKLKGSYYSMADDGVYFAHFDAGWKAALDEAENALNNLSHDSHNAYQVRMDCIEAIGELK